MARRKPPPTPTFTPWDGKAIVIRHHETNLRIGRITHLEASEPGWYLTWEYGELPGSHHDDALTAIATACDSYTDYLRMEDEVLAEDRYREQFLQRQAGAVARAVRIPTGGQKSWVNKRPPTER